MASDVDLYVIPGGKVGESAAKNFIHRLAPTWVDGLIVAAHTIGHRATEQQMAEFLETLRPTPTVTLGDVPGADCSLSIDNEQAAHTLTRHLVLQHRHKHFVYVSGPDGNAEALARELGFMRALREAELTLPAERRLVGDFTWEGGRNAIVELIEGRAIDIEQVQAVVCANDAMAVGVCMELERRDRYIPRDITVVGFDDTEVARHLPAPLTTVHQPLRELLFDAVGMLVEALAMGTRPKGAHRYTAECILRRSCGCPRLPDLPRPSTPAPASGAIREASLGVLEPALREDVDGTFAEVLDRVSPGWLAQLLEALTTQLEKRDAVFHDTLEVICLRLLRARTITSGWQDALLAMRRHVARAGMSIDKRGELDRVVEGAMRLTSEMAASYMARQREELLEQLRVLSDATAGLLAAPDLGTINQVTRSSFPKLGVEKGVVYLFTSAFCPDVEATPLSVFGLDNEPPLATLAARNLGQGGLPHRQNWVIEPLGAGARPLGLAVMQTGLAHVSWYERLRDALTAAVNGAQLVEQVQRLVVTDPLTGLSNRRHLAQRIRCELDGELRRRPLSLLVLDLDGFKALNDEQGHDAGDRALIAAASSIKHCLRDTDTLARFGGDEFVAVLPGATAEQARCIAQRVLENLPPDVLQNVSASLTCSIGIATVEDQIAVSEMELFRLADQALLAAKRGGKNRVVHARDRAD